MPVLHTLSPVIHLQHDHVVGVYAGDGHHQEGGQDQEAVKGGQAQQEGVDGAGHGGPADIM